MTYRPVIALLIISIGACFVAPAACQVPSAGEGQLTITVVPDSVSDHLQGLDGRMTIKIENGKQFNASNTRCHKHFELKGKQHDSG